MDYIKAISFNGARRGKIMEAKESLVLMKEKTGCNTVILVVGAFQETSHSEKIDYRHSTMPRDEELVEIIRYCKKIGLQVILKPVIHCKDGTWHAYISFFDSDVVCEPKWSVWFNYYTDYIIHYAKIANETCCDMFVVGCQLVHAERREVEWRKLIKEVRKVYHGAITYNTDKYQEGNITWWDAVDVISSSGYYPMYDWDNQLERIESVARRYNKPFFFAEIGCKSTKYASQVPHDWTFQGELSLEEQEEYFEYVFNICRNRTFVRGFGIWGWNSRLYQEQDGIKDRGYFIFGKPVCQLIRKEWTYL